MDKKSPGVISLLSDLVSIDSQSFKGNKAIIALLKGWFKAYECTTQDWITQSDDVQGQNLIVKIPGKSSEKSLVFVGHMDTVPVGDLWETNPFILEDQGGKLYGRGTCDTKGGVASLIEAVLTLPDQPTHDIYLLFDGDEEKTWAGLKKYKKSLSLKSPYFICIEPTDHQLCIADRSILSFEVHTFGVSLHASYATPEVNNQQSAIYKMQHVIAVLIDDANSLARENDEVMGTNTQNLGMIQGGIAQNVIPEFCKLQIDRRLLSSRNLEDELVRIKELVYQVDPTAKVTRVVGEKGFSTSKEEVVVQNVLKSVCKKYPKAITTSFQAMSEGAICQDKGPVMVLGPGSIKQAHVANEFIESQDLFHFVHIFQDIMLAV